MPNHHPVEFSVVMPCLNEADTVSTCVAKAVKAIREAGIHGEVIVADNGSTDGSQRLAEANGARVVPVEAKGYGNALMGGIASAKGKWILMGDADDSYDFLQIPAFYARLKDGFDLVQGCRLPSGGGTVMPGAMPWSHRWIGNPMFSWMARTWFHAPIHDVYCGMRAFSKTHYVSLRQQCTGMEFATEMIIKSSLYGARITEVPITLHPDGRKAHAPHLKTMRDGWRTLRFFLMYSPRWLFLLPGTLLILAGFMGGALALTESRVGVAQLGPHTLLYSCVAIICGYQAILFSLFTKTFAMSEGLTPQDPRVLRFFEVINLERGIALGATAFISGVLLMVYVFLGWGRAGFGDLDYSDSMRWAVPGATLTALGFQTILSGFFMSILGMKRRC